MSGISINSVYLVKLYKYYFSPQPPPKKVIVLKNTFKHHNIYKNLYCDNIIKNKKNEHRLKHGLKFSECLEDIKNQNSIIYWIYKNNIKELLKYKIVVLDFQAVYDYKNKKDLNMDYLKKLSKYLLDNKIIFCIISEINPKFFPDINNFNPVNLVTPYHYKSKSFGGVVKIGINKYNNKSVQVSLNKLIIDIKNQYGYNDEELVYINTKKIDNINTIEI